MLLLIAKLDALATATFSGYNPTPVTPEAAFTDLEDSLFRYNHTLWAAGVVAIATLYVSMRLEGWVGL